ncbi:Arogenate dehydrogenase 1 [Hibiscus syriacus]|uniref:Arogenate dehydrogenase 1 n=1 Tax=Hibiscus syriacus TaxID=106335 RepID=A0A6A2YU91_HIBSY|nr:Arogenate dehydrogenase 1 [Hibiscus syriacus]
MMNGKRWTMVMVSTIGWKDEGTLSNVTSSSSLCLRITSSPPYEYKSPPPPPYVYKSPPPPPYEYKSPPPPPYVYKSPPPPPYVYKSPPPPYVYKSPPSPPYVYESPPPPPYMYKSPPPPPYVNKSPPPPPYEYKSPPPPYVYKSPPPPSYEYKSPPPPSYMYKSSPLSSPPSPQIFRSPPPPSRFRATTYYYIGISFTCLTVIWTMIKQGHTLRATSRTDYSHICHQLGISFFRDVIAFLEADNDVILIATSILSLSEVLRSMPLHSFKRRTLFVDVLSVKEHPRNVLLQVLPEEMDVLCTPPMFGPESCKNGWKDLPIVFEKVRVRDEPRCSNFLQSFESEGCRMVEMSCEEHDKPAARSRFLTRTVGRILLEMGIESTSMNTKSFETLVKLKESMATASFDLFDGLFIHSRFTQQESILFKWPNRDWKNKILARSDYFMDSC